MPSVPGVDQPFKIGAVALGPPAAAAAHSPDQWRDIQLIDRDGSSQSLTEQLPKLFLPYPGQTIWPGQHSDAAALPQMRMHVNDRQVSRDFHIWTHVRDQRSKPSARIPIQLTRDSPAIGHMQIMKVPNSVLTGPYAKECTGIIYAMPGSDVVFNLVPEVRSCHCHAACKCSLIIIPCSMHSQHLTIDDSPAHRRLCGRLYTLGAQVSRTWSMQACSDWTALLQSHQSRLAYELQKTHAERNAPAQPSHVCSH